MQYLELFSHFSLGEISSHAMRGTLSQKFEKMVGQIIKTMEYNRGSSILKLHTMHLAGENVFISAK